MGNLVDITVPKIGLTTTEVTVGGWMIKPQQTIARGEVIVTVETDKASNEIEAPSEGMLVEILAREGTTVPVGGLLGRLQVMGAGEGTAYETDTPAHAPFKYDDVDPQPADEDIEHQKIDQPPPQPAAIVRQDDKRLIATPYARRLAQDRGIDLREVRGYGPRGRITAKDVPQSPPTEKPRQDVPAETLISQTAIYDIDATSLMRFIEKAKKADIREVPLVFFLACAAARALQHLGESDACDPKIAMSHIRLADASGSETIAVISQADCHLPGTLARYVSLIRDNKQSEKPEPAPPSKVTVCEINDDGMTFWDHNPLQGLVLRATAPKKVLVPDCDSQPSVSRLMQIALTYDTRSVTATIAKVFLQNVAHYLVSPKRLLL